MKKIICFLFFQFFCNSLLSQCWSKIESGSGHTLAILQDGTLWGWGGGIYGQLGDGTNLNRSLPIQIGTDNHWTEIAGGQVHSIAVKSDGTLWAWGKNTNGQLGDGTLLTRNVPIQIGTATNWSKVMAGFQHSIALKTDGTIWAWGDNFYGQLGDGSFTDRLVPTKVGFQNDWASICAGIDSTGAIKNDGTYWAWGWNSSGQLGDGTSVDRVSPVHIGGPTTWQSVSMSTDGFTLAIKSDGTLWVCGYNYYGELGLGFSGGAAYNLTQLGTDTWMKVKGGYAFAKGIKSDGTLWAWGSNAYKVFGLVTVLGSNSPIQIGTDTWQSVTSGNQFSIQLKSDGTLWGCGENFYTGSGITTGNSSVLVNAICPGLEVTENIKKTDFYIYPNPVIDKISLIGYNEEDIESIKILDLIGKELISTNGSNVINVENLEAGIYFLQVCSNATASNRFKFIKK